MTSCRNLALVSLMLGATVGSAEAQTSVTADIGFNSQYVWRGVTSTNRPVIQPDLSISIPLRSLTLTSGVWGNLEPVRYDGPRDLSSLNGLAGPLVTQSEAYTEIAGTFKHIDVSFGAQGYFYPTVGDLADYNTVELYSTAAFAGVVSPSVTVNYDVGQVRGAYIETALSHGVTGERHGSVTLGVAAGFSAGQGTDPRGHDLAYFDRDGLTHVDASASGSFSIGHVAFSPEMHVIFANDALATVVAPDVTRRTKVWFGTTLRWSSR